MGSQTAVGSGASAPGSDRSFSTSSPDRRRGRLIVISGPSGVGKSSIVDRLAARMPFTFSVSATTRRPRPGEVEGEDYHFVDREQFRSLRRDGELLESAEYSGHWYGTLRRPVLAALERGEDVLLDIENHGAEQVKHAFPAAVLVFIAPPSWEELEQRLTRRGDTAPEDVARRLAVSRSQIESATSVFDHTVVNDDLAAAVDRLAGILAAPTRQPVQTSAPGADRPDPDTADIEEPETSHDD